MRERTELVGGELTTESSPEHGTRIVLSARITTCVEPFPRGGWGMTSVSDAPQPTAPLRILPVDDQPLFRRASATLINGQDDLEVVAETVNGLDGVAKASSLTPDVCNT